MKLLDRARALAPLLASSAKAAETVGEIAVETVAAFHEAGFWRVLRPARFGGMGGPFTLFSAIAEELATGCAATAWVYTVLGEHAWVIAQFPEQAQHEVWGADPDALACSSLIPRTVARRVAGGWMLGGTFPFASGSAWAEWAILGALCDAGAGPEPRYLLVPMAQARRADDWQVLGLRATGSRSLVLEETFVPEHRSVRLADLMAGTAPGRAAHPGYTLGAAPRYLLVPYSLPSVAVGLGRHALAVAAELLASRKARAAVKLAESEFVQVELGRAAAEIAAACTIRASGCAAAEAALATPPVPEAAIAAHRRDMAFATDLVRTGIERLAALAGTEIVQDRSPLQGLLRDALTIATHGVVTPREAMGDAGRALLGAINPM
ncbi:MAG: acyl-CoA dehydrogenase family protein [Rhodospirillales bacterium]|nr:acyl-CoA dehydrogenase family protein [Rhodospirillales bacterium]